MLHARIRRFECKWLMNNEIALGYDCWNSLASIGHSCFPDGRRIVSQSRWSSAIHGGISALFVVSDEWLLDNRSSMQSRWIAPPIKLCQSIALVLAWALSTVALVSQHATSLSFAITSAFTFCSPVLSKVVILLYNLVITKCILLRGDIISNSNY